MKDLFYLGGNFMSYLTLLLLAIVAWAIYYFSVFLNNREKHEKVLQKLRDVKAIGLFTMILGILGQLVGIYAAFSAIEEAADINPAMIFGGIKASMVCPIYGIIIYLFSVLLWFIFSTIVEKMK